MRRWSRRDAVTFLGLGTAGLLVGPRGRAAARKLELGDLTALAERFRAASRASVFDVAADAIRAGADYRTLLGGAFMAGVHDVQPRGVGGKLHCVMMVESAFLLSETASPREAWLAALWSIDDFKRSQERDRGDGDWVLPPRPEVSFSSERQARRELVAAMDAWDAERADRAIVGLLPHLDRGSLFEVLWPYAARCYVDIGHKIIFCAQVERALGRLGWRHAEPALRSLVAGLLYVSDSISGSEAGVFEHARQVARSFPDDWLAGKDDPAVSEGLLRQLRECDAAAAQDLVAGALADGLGPATVWDGLRLYASELLQRRPKSAARRHGPVHGVTEVNAFAHVWRTTANETTKRLMILQAAGWLPLMRRDLERFFGPQQGPGLDDLGRAASGNAAPNEVPDFVDIFSQPSPEAARLRLDRSPRAAADYLAQLRRHLTERAFQSHQYKYAAAIAEESALAHPRWASRILAPAVTYVPTPNDPDSQVFDRSLHALRQAGVMGAAS